MDTSDPVLRQLRKLREGVGLTAERLQQSGAVMAALASSDPAVAYQELVRLLASLGDGDRARALQVDLAIDLPALLDRPPYPRERDWLGDRRSSYGQLIGRDVKTLARWSNQALGELRAALLHDQFTGHLYVVAGVDGNRILGSTTIQRPIDAAATEAVDGSSTEYPNPSAEPSMPCFIYGYPRDWKPAKLTLAVVFRRLPHPASIWAVVAPNFFELVYATERYLLAIDDGGTATCTFVRPRTDQLYGIFWRN